MSVKSENTWLALSKENNGLNKQKKLSKAVTGHSESVSSVHGIAK